MATSAEIKVGKLGKFLLPAGWYAYVGSAMGSGGLHGRLQHHLTPVRYPHWHIDYLRGFTVCQQVWAIDDGLLHEHQWAIDLRHMPGSSIPVPRFGSSDCHCETHLFHFIEPPALDVFREQTQTNVFLTAYRETKLNQ